MQHQESQTDSLLVARLDNSKNLSNLLKAIHFKDVSIFVIQIKSDKNGGFVYRSVILFIFQTATIFISANGLKVTVEESKYAQASAFIQSSVFQEYSFDEESATFKINLSALLV